MLYIVSSQADRKFYVGERPTHLLAWREIGLGRMASVVSRRCGILSPSLYAERSAHYQERMSVSVSADTITPSSRFSLVLQHPFLFALFRDGVSVSFHVKSSGSQSVDRAQIGG
jgi:hypothetical protein